MLLKVALFHSFLCYPNDLFSDRILPSELIDHVDFCLMFADSQKLVCRSSLKNWHMNTSLFLHITDIFSILSPHTLVDKESDCNTGDSSSIPGLGRSPGEGKGCPLWCSGLENSMDCLDRVAKSWTWLSDFHFHFPFCRWLKICSWFPFVE